MLIVEARQKAASDRALSIGWYAEAFARTKRLQKLGKLLAAAPSSVAKKLQGGASRAKSMFRNFRQAQEDDDGKSR